MQQGQQTEALTLVMHLLARQLDPVEATLEAHVQDLSQIQLKNLAEALLDFSETADLMLRSNTYTASIPETS